MKKKNFAYFFAKIHTVRDKKVHVYEHFEVLIITDAVL